MAGIRVIAGKAKGRRLKMVPGEGTRPVADRVKEALFNIIHQEIVEASFWDMFAGTGSVGIEALSRGARHVYFTDNDRLAIETINENLAITQLAGSGSVERADVFQLLPRKKTTQFEFVYIAPPQYRSLWSRALTEIDQNTGWLYPDAWVIVQIDPHEAEEIELNELEKFDERKYGSTVLLFYEWASE